MLSWCLVPFKRPFVKDGNYNNKWGNCKERCKLTPKWLNRSVGCFSSHFPPHKYYKPSIKIFCFQLLNKSNRPALFSKTTKYIFYFITWNISQFKRAKKYSEKLNFLFQAPARSTMHPLLIMKKACKISNLALQNQDHFSNFSKSFCLIFLTKFKTHTGIQTLV